MGRAAIDITGSRLKLGEVGRKGFIISLAIGILFLAISLLLGWMRGDGMARFYEAYLVAFLFWLSLSLGALFFVLIQHLTGASWSVVVRRLAEAVAANLPLLALLALPILAGMRHLYVWSDPEVVSHDALIQLKSGYLNTPFFIARLALYFALWSWLAFYYKRRSTAQDSSGDVMLTHRMQRMSAPAVAIFALTVTFAAFDLIMSVEPHWFSTIFGVYFFAGSFLAFVALLALSSHWLQGRGFLQQIITREHYHDLGKLIFAFVVFWAYIGFSQYMLIWYANIPEETYWYLQRQTGGWTAFSVLLIFGHFFIPFLALLSRYPKRQMLMLVPGTLWVLLMHWVDLYWLVMPTFSPGRLPLHIMDLTILLGLGGIFAALLMRRLGKHSLVPEKDPRLNDSLVFENA